MRSCDSLGDTEGVTHQLGPELPRTGHALGVLPRPGSVRWWTPGDPSGPTRWGQSPCVLRVEQKLN